MAIKDTISAKFKGVSFFVYSEMQEGGRKLAIHEYPGSDDRFAEDLGKRPGIFRINGYIGGGDNWIQKAKRLTTVLEESTEGILELSTFGILRVKTQSFTKTVKHTALGMIDFTITFLVTTANPSPVIASSNIESVAGAVSDVLTKVQEDFENRFTIPDLITTVKVAEYDGEQLTQTVADKIRSLGQFADTVTAKFNHIRDNIADLIRDPIAYAAAVFSDGLLGTVFDTVAASREALKAFSKLTRVGYNLATDFGSINGGLLYSALESFDIPSFSDDARYRLTNNNNRLLITNGMRTSIFAIYLDQAARNDYATDSDINDVISDIDDIYNNVILIAGVDPIIALSVDRCRVEALRVLEDKLQTTPKVVDFNLKIPTVDIELAYRLYAEEFVDNIDLTDKADVLTELNGVLPTRYKDTVQVLKI